MCADQADASRDDSHEMQNSAWGGSAGAREQRPAPAAASCAASPAEADDSRGGASRVWTLGLGALFVVVELAALAAALGRLVEQGVYWPHLGAAACFWIGITGALLVASRRDRRRHDAPGGDRPGANDKAANDKAANDDAANDKAANRESSNENSVPETNPT